MVHFESKRRVSAIKWTAAMARAHTDSCALVNMRWRRSKYSMLPVRWASSSAVATGDSSKQDLACMESVGLYWTALNEAKPSYLLARRNASL